MSGNVELPYFDVVFQDKEKKEKYLDQTLNMHWGYWEDPAKAYTSDDQKFKPASENLSRLIYSAVDIKEGVKLADVGCGFGGTIDLINHKFNNINMVGINIDPRQIEAARENVKPVNNNKIEFITGDACDLPFEDESIDCLTAVECIFHFENREKFFSEVARVLKPGGKFAFSDFVPQRKIEKLRILLRQAFMAIVGRHYGSASLPQTVGQYNEIGRRYGLENICALDINANVMPTYKAIYFLINRNQKGLKFHKKIPTFMLEFSQKTRQVLYMVIGYQKTKK